MNKLHVLESAAVTDWRWLTPQTSSLVATPTGPPLCKHVKPTGQEFDMLAPLLCPQEQAYKPSLPERVLGTFKTESGKELFSAMISHVSFGVARGCCSSFMEEPVFTQSREERQ